jgi:ABC-type proline/glycine betaine transport system permease subunit
MTDIEAKALDIAYGWFDYTQDDQTLNMCDLTAAIATALREARTQALEEAAWVANKIGGDLGESGLGHTIATGIRAMKDTTP